MELDKKRPIITEFDSPEDYASEMISYRKYSEDRFSVMAETKKLRKVSSTLVSLILKKKRKITLDRVDEFSKLLNLNLAEKLYFKNWIEGKEIQVHPLNDKKEVRRKKTSIHILNDWLNLYVKDYFEIKEIQNNPNLIYERLANIAPPQRIKKSLDFLLKYGYLRKKLDGSIVLDTPLTVTDPKIASHKIRNFHKNALKLARLNMDIFPTTERYANTSTIALTKKKYAELIQLIEEFSERFQQFSELASKDFSDDFINEPHNKNGDVVVIPKESVQIYQFILNLSPAGGKTNDQ
jgi:uncharacterized protein (TIGR02147 family)